VSLSSGHDEIVVEELDGVLVLTLNRVAKRNALNHATLTALADVLADATGGGARALVITGDGSKAFCAGADITELAVIDGHGAGELVRRGQRVFNRLEELSLPTVAAINGVALGGGLELAMACDLRVAAEHATFGMPEITLANVPGWGGTQRLPHLVGYGRATQMILTGVRIDAARANDWGLVNAVVPGASLRAHAVEIARGLAEHSSTAIDHAKRALRIGRRYGLHAGLDAEEQAVVKCTGSSDQRHATQSFLARP
jgi:enoyl-CoA hydratase